MHILGPIVFLLLFVWIPQAVWQDAVAARGDDHVAMD